MYGLIFYFCPFPKDGFEKVDITKPYTTREVEIKAEMKYDTVNKLLVAAQLHKLHITVQYLERKVDTVDQKREINNGTKYFDNR